MKKAKENKPKATTTKSKETKAKKTPAKKRTRTAPKTEAQKAAVLSGITRLSEFDIYLFREGKHFSLYEKLGAHLMEHEGQKGVYFAVWAPNAERVTVVGDFNGWNKDTHLLYPRWDESGIWEGFIPGIEQGTVYKYAIKSHNQGYSVEKGDPFGYLWETPPKTASVVWDLKYKWGDKKWLDARKKKEKEPQPYSVYELHMGSWRRVPEEGNRPYTYRELARELPEYLKWLGYTHVEFLPVMEHPFYGSWGYQTTGYFAPTSRFGSPQDFMYLVDALHKEGIGVILDWVPSHFPSDQHGLDYFDGTHLFEHSDPRLGFHPDWKSNIFNYGRNEVRSFLISSALFWLDLYHADGLRVDAVASMLYLDYSRKEGEWLPNAFGGRENLEAIQFLKDFNDAVQDKFPDTVTVAEESTSWPMVSRPTQIGGLGFDMKWMMGWMHDTLEYMTKDPMYRSYHQGQITFSIIYAFTEHFMLPLSHDEVVHGKGPLIDKMPGDEWQKFANLRALYGYMYAHPGSKLLFMGGEFGQTQEWRHEQSLDWHLNDFHFHKGVQLLTKDLNDLYKTEKALYEKQFDWDGFEWVDLNDAHNSVITFLRKGKNPEDEILVVINFTPVVRENYRVGVAHPGHLKEIFNSDDTKYGGSGVHNHSVESMPVPMHGRERSVNLTLPPLGVMFLKF